MLHYSSHDELRQAAEGGQGPSSFPFEVEGHVARSGHEALLQALAQDEQEAGVEEWEPVFPTVDQATELNQTAYELYGQGQWGGVRAPNELESAINRAQQHWYYGYYEQPDDDERLLTAAAKMMYGMHMSQPFVDGNKRTAFWLTRHFLDQNGFGHVMPLDQEDEEVADHLHGHAEGSHSEEDTANLFIQRHRAQPQQ